MGGNRDRERERLVAIGRDGKGVNEARGCGVVGTVTLAAVAGADKVFDVPMQLGPVELARDLVEGTCVAIVTELWGFMEGCEDRCAKCRTVGDVDLSVVMVQERRCRIKAVVWDSGGSARWRVG